MSADLALALPDLGGPLDETAASDRGCSGGPRGTAPAAVRTAGASAPVASEARPGAPDRPRPRRRPSPWRRRRAAPRLAAARGLGVGRARGRRRRDGRAPRLAARRFEPLAHAADHAAARPTAARPCPRGAPRPRRARRRRRQVRRAPPPHARRRRRVRPRRRRAVASAPRPRPPATVEPVARGPRRDRAARPGRASSTRRAATPPRWPRPGPSCAREPGNAEAQALAEDAEADMARGGRASRRPARPCAAATGGGAVAQVRAGLAVNPNDARLLAPLPRG